MKTLTQLLKEHKKQSGNALTYDDLMKKRKEDNEKFIHELDENKKNANIQNALGRSGILPLHQFCTTYNYNAKTKEQKYAKQFAHFYAENFSSNNGCGFIFSGKSGTGKNHLSASICNKLIPLGYSCLVITISDLMMKLRKCYGKNPECSEDEFIEMLVKFDLLIFDEIGLQRGSDNEKLILNQIIDQRISRYKPTGMLTNLHAKAVNELLGVRIMDRMRMNGGEWIPFEWESYRK